MKKADRFSARQTGLARRMVQGGFLLLFLYPLLVSLYQRVTFASTPTLTSWLLPWDVGLLLGQALSREWSVLVVGAPLALLSFSLLFGRSFCGWICPLGTVLDLFRPLAFWQGRRSRRNSGVFPPRKNSRARYYLLAAVLCASAVSLKLLGLLDPLVIVNRTWITFSANLLAANRSGANATIALISLIFLAILVLDWWQPRLWCRNLCPVGALISLVSRFSILRRWVNPQRCTGCRQCERVCGQNAIYGNGILTDYTHCTFCLECLPECPQQGVHFSFISPVNKASSSGSVNSNKPIPHPLPVSQNLNRREFIGLLGAGAVGLSLTTALDLLPRQPALRPPGSLPEKDFLRTCILCQECIRVCPTGGLRPALMEHGVMGVGAPMLVPRLGGCALNPSCPDLCAQVCPVGAILPVTKTEMKIGLAYVDRTACLAWDQGAKCLVCVEACLNSAAIPHNGRVTVDPNHCTGCGRCESGCPVPGSAIRVRPFDSPVS